MLYGYIGKMLFVNLSNGDIEKRELTEELVKNFPGGPALGAKILYDEMPAKCDIFGPESMFGIVGGPLTGTGTFFSGRYTVVSKSPVYNGWNDANSGGFFAPMLKKSGYDAIFVKGIAEKPVYLYINDGEVEIRDASAMWGKPVEEAEALIKEDIGNPKARTCVVGPAGERKSHMAAVMNDGHRAAGRGGTGAVMGSKNLKGIAVYGTQTVPVYDKEKLKELNKKIADNLKNGPMAGAAAGLGMFGTPGIYVGNVIGGDCASKNWGSYGGDGEQLTQEQLEALSPMKMDPQWKVKKYACSSCPIGCGAIYSVDSEKYPYLKHTTRPEYETVGLAGAIMLNDDPIPVIAINHLCNDYGFDTISATGTLAWVMEMYSEGLLTKDDLDGIEVPWGAADAAVEILEKMCKGEGCGEILQHGSAYAADYYGKGHEFLAVATGIEQSAHDCRFSQAISRQYQYDPSPGRHTKGGYGPGYGRQPIEVKSNPKGKGFGDTLLVANQELQNASGLCNMGAMGILGMRRELMTAATGIEYTPFEEYRQGIRSYTMRHCFNLREGLTRKDFYLSDRLIKGPDKGPLKDVVVDNEAWADTFFDAMHWNPETMVPAKEELQFLGGMDEVIADLYPAPKPQG